MSVTFGCWKSAQTTKRIERIVQRMLSQKFVVCLDWARNIQSANRNSAQLLLFLLLFNYSMYCVFMCAICPIGQLNIVSIAGHFFFLHMTQTEVPNIFYLSRIHHLDLLSDAIQRDANRQTNHVQNVCRSGIFVLFIFISTIHFRIDII